MVGSIKTGNEGPSDGTPVLYTRAGCHLCEIAESMLDRLAADWRTVDIEQDAELEETYGLRIPVVRLPRSDRELDFPFDEATLAEFLE